LCATRGKTDAETTITTTISVIISISISITTITITITIIISFEHCKSKKIRRLDSMLICTNSGRQRDL
jgi:hypothetical protein